MLDELATIGDCLRGFEAQTYPIDRLEVVVVDGGSTDGSRQLVDDLAEVRSWLRVVENPRRKAAAAFNVGVAAAKGDIVFLFSAHGIPMSDYVARSVDVLRQGGAAGVGGKYLHEGTDPTSRAIGLAMSSPFGMASPHRFSNDRQDVDTISHPAYWRAALQQVGEFDESLDRNSDYEMNWRLREAGHRLVFEPAIRSVYRPRRTLAALGRQFWWYGRWKATVLQRHPRSLRPRHVVPPIAVAAVMAAPVGWRFPRVQKLLCAGGLGYLAVLGAALLDAQPSRVQARPATFLAALPVMHAAWGGGFLATVLERLTACRARR